MGYNGMGYQRWIATMKPKKFLQKRSKPDGGGMNNDTGIEIQEYFHFKQNNLNNLLQKKYTKAQKFKINKKIQLENRKELLIQIVSFLIALVLLISALIYLNSKMHWF